MTLYSYTNRNLDYTLTSEESLAAVPRVLEPSILESFGDDRNDDE